MAKMSGRKATVFWVVNIQLVLLYVLTLLVQPQLIDGIGNTIIVMIVGNGATYIGGNVASLWQKSKNYRPELDDKTTG